MKKSIMAFVMFFMMITTTSVWAQSNVYIDQQDSGTGLDIDIFIDGAGSRLPRIFWFNWNRFNYRGSSIFNG